MNKNVDISLDYCTMTCRNVIQYIKETKGMHKIVNLKYLFIQTSCKTATKRTVTTKARKGLATFLISNLILNSS